MYKYILTPPVMCTQQLLVLPSMDSLLKQKFPLFAFQKLLTCRSHIFAVWFNKTKFFLWNTKNTDRNDVYKQNTHTTDKEKHNFRKGWLVLHPFLEQPLYFTCPSFLWENSDPPPFLWENLENSTTIFITGR